MRSSNLRNEKCEREKEIQQSLLLKDETSSNGWETNGNQWYSVVFGGKPIVIDEKLVETREI